MKILIVYDKKSETYDRPMFFKTVVEAIRAFELAINEKESIFSKYKEDFEMVCIGELDMVSAQLVAFEQHQVVCKGLDYLPLKDENGQK